jgi:hypothetical protein
MGPMLKKPTPMHHELETVTLEELAPEDHLLRKIDAAVDFEFVREKVAHLYCADKGRPTLDPVSAFRRLHRAYACPCNPRTSKLLTPSRSRSYFFLISSFIRTP